MPTLQGLPQEILEMIFLHSMNISLPRCSPDLGRKLSSHYIRMTFTMRTMFDSTDAKDPLISQNQFQLMKSKFFTWSFFLDYVKAAHATVLKRRHKAWTTVVVPDVSYFNPLWPFKFRQVRYLGLSETFTIPEKLLHGPWNEDKASLLYVLVAFGGEIDWHGSMAGETAKDGLDDAVREGNEVAVAALAVLLGIERKLGTDVLRFAVMESGCSINIIRHLLYNAQILYRGHEDTEVLNFHDPGLWTWADNAAKRGDTKGEILKSMLRDADRFDMDFYFEHETDFAKIVPFPYSGDKFDPRGGWDRLKREMMTRLYWNHGRSIMAVPGGVLGNRDREGGGGDEGAGNS